MSVGSSPGGDTAHPQTPVVWICPMTDPCSLATSRYPVALTRATFGDTSPRVFVGLVDGSRVGVGSTGSAGRFGVGHLVFVIGMSGTTGGNVKLPSTQSIDGLCQVSQLCPSTLEQDRSSCVM